MHAQKNSWIIVKVMTYYQIFNQPIMNTKVQKQVSSSSPMTYSGQWKDSRSQQLWSWIYQQPLIWWTMKSYYKFWNKTSVFVERLFTGLQTNKAMINVSGKYSKAMDLRFNVPQGSCSGTNIFTCYCIIINESGPSSITLTGFVDDHSIRISFWAKCHKSDKNTINTIEVL